MAMTEKVLQLVKEAKGGDEGSFGELYKIYVQKIFRFVNYLINDRDMAQDITQNTFVKAWKKMNKFQVKNGSFQAYIYTIARNLVKDFFRKKKMASLLFYENKLSTDEVLNSVIDNENNLKIKKMLAILDKFERDLIVFRFFEDLSFKEISEIIGKKESAVRVRTHRALKKIKNNFDNLI